MNKSQDEFIKAQLDMLDTQFKDLDKKLGKIYKANYKNRELLLDKISRVILEYEVKSDKLTLSYLKQKELLRGIQLSLFNMIESEILLDNKMIEDYFKEVALSTYDYSAYMLGLGANFELKLLTDMQIARIVNSKIAGQIWSKRLWKNKKDLEVILKSAIKKCFKGEIDINNIYKIIKGQFEADNRNVRRLVNTELARVQQGAIDKFCVNAGIDWQVFIATLDLKTSNICKDYDGKRYRVDDVNKPQIPLHPHCRSVLATIPNGDYKIKNRRDNVTGEIIEYKTYKEWEKDR